MYIASREKVGIICRIFFFFFTNRVLGVAVFFLFFFSVQCSGLSSGIVFAGMIVFCERVVISVFCKVMKVEKRRKKTIPNRLKWDRSR